jgi:2-C-methyl-D-erythritol 2,4-cyclodiphosphate synthase
MREHLAVDLGAGAGQIGIKATTSEKLGFTGRGEGIAVLAVVLLLTH